MSRTFDKEARAVRLRTLTGYKRTAEAPGEPSTEPTQAPAAGMAMPALEQLNAHVQVMQATLTEMQAVLQARAAASRPASQPSGLRWWLRRSSGTLLLWALAAGLGLTAGTVYVAWQQRALERADAAGGTPDDRPDAVPAAWPAAGEGRETPPLASPERLSI